MYLQASHKFIKFTFAMSLRLTIDVQIKKIINRKLYYSQVHIILETIFNSFFETWILCHFYKSTGNMKQNHLFKAPDNFFVIKNPVDCANSSFGAFFIPELGLLKKSHSCSFQQNLWIISCPLSYHTQYSVHFRVFL